MASRSSCAISLAAALALAGPARAGRTVIDFSGPAAAGFIQANLGKPPRLVPGPAGERALELVLSPTPDGWTEVDFAFGEQFLLSDWSKWAAAELDVENRGAAPLLVGLRLRNTPASDAPGKMAVVTAKVAPGARARLRAPLLALKFAKDFLQWPSAPGLSEIESDGRVDPGHIVEAGVFVETPSEARLRLRRLELVERLPKGPWIDERGRSLLSPPRAEPPEKLPSEPPTGPSYPRGKFFAVERDKDGKAWLRAPDGAPFFASCLGGVTIDVAAAWDAERRKAYAWVPPRSGRWAEAWLDAKALAAPGQERWWPSFYRANLLRKRGPGLEEPFLRKARARLAAWGFNCLGPWSDERAGLFAPIPYFSEGPGPLPGVFEEGFEAAAEKAAAPLAELKNDPLLIGHFFDEEQHWDKYEERAAEAAEKYCRVVAAAVRKADPNHLLLGPRFSTTASSQTLAAVAAACAPHVDVLSLDDFSYAPTPLVPGKPRLVSAYSFNSLDTGQLSAAVPVAGLAERAAGLSYFLEACAADADCLGASYYQYLDEPVTGRPDGDTALNGLVDVEDAPYGALVEAAKASNARVGAIRAGRTAPTERRPAR